MILHKFFLQPLQGFLDLKIPYMPQLSQMQWSLQKSNIVQSNLHLAMKINSKPITPLRMHILALKVVRPFCSLISIVVIYPI